MRAGRAQVIGAREAAVAQVAQLGWCLRVRGRRQSV